MPGTALHAAATEQHADTALDAGAKFLRLFEGATLLVCRTLRALPAAALRDALGFHAGGGAERDVVPAVEPPVAARQIREHTEALPVAMHSERHLHIGGRVTVAQP